MTRRSHRPRQIAILAIGMLAATSLIPALANQAYPPNWNTPATATAPVLYDFVPGGGNVRHRLPQGATAPARSNPSISQSTTSKQ